MRKVRQWIGISFVIVICALSGTQTLSQECYSEAILDCEPVDTGPSCSGSTCIWWYKVNGEWITTPTPNAEKKRDCANPNEDISTNEVSITYATVVLEGWGQEGINVGSDVTCYYVQDCSCDGKIVGDPCFGDPNIAVIIHSIPESWASGEECLGTGW